MEIILALCFMVSPMSALSKQAVAFLVFGPIGQKGDDAVILDGGIIDDLDSECKDYERGGKHVSAIVCNHHIEPPSKLKYTCLSNCDTA
jgi:hypothetical protein